MVNACRPPWHLRKWIGLGALVGIAALGGCATSSGGPEGLAPMVENAGVLKSILEPVFAGRDFQPLFDRLAHDVVLVVTISGDARPGREFRGKRRVMAFFLSENAIHGFGQGGPLEYSGRGGRVVVEGAPEPGVDKSGLTVGGRESAVVVDFENGRIKRFLVVQDAFPPRVATRR